MPSKQRAVPAVVVSSDRAEVARVREAAAAASPKESAATSASLDRLLESDHVPLYEAQVASALRGATDEHLSVLRAISTGEGGASGGARANATILLGLLGEADASDRLNSLLSSADPVVLQAALAQLVRNGRLARPLLTEPTVPAAIDSAAHRSPVSIRGLQLRLLLDPLADVSVDVVEGVCAAGMASPDKETVAAVSSVLHQLLGRGEVPEARAAATLLLRRAVTLPPGHPRGYDVWAASLVAGSEALDSLEALAGDGESGIAAEAAHALARLKGREVLPLLVPRLDDPKQRSRAADAIGLVLENTEDATMIRRLTQTALADAEGRSRAALARALVRISGPLARATALGLIPSLGGPELQRVLWALEGITLEDAVAAAAAAGLIGTLPDEHEWRRLRVEDLGGIENEVSQLWTLLYRRKLLFSFDTAGAYPPRHDRLLAEAAAASRGLLAPEAIVQTGSPEGVEYGEAAYRLSFVSGGRAYEVSCRHYGDKYDREAVLAAAHRALADTGREQRFVAVVIGAPEAYYLFGRADQLRALCDRLFIPLGERTTDDAIVQELKDRLAVGLP